MTRSPLRPLLLEIEPLLHIRLISPRSIHTAVNARLVRNDLAVHMLRLSLVRMLISLIKHLRHVRRLHFALRPS